MFIKCLVYCKCSINILYPSKKKKKKRIAVPSDWGSTSVFPGHRKSTTASQYWGNIVKNDDTFYYFYFLSSSVLKIERE